MSPLLYVFKQLRRSSDPALTSDRDEHAMLNNMHIYILYIDSGTPRPGDGGRKGAFLTVNVRKVYTCK